MEHREHDPGIAGLFHTGLETPDTGSNCALCCCNCYLVVSCLVERHVFVYSDTKLLTVICVQVAPRVCPMVVG